MFVADIVADESAFANYARQDVTGLGAIAGATNDPAMQQVLAAAAAGLTVKCMLLTGNTSGWQAAIPGDPGLAAYAALDCDDTQFSGLGDGANTDTVDGVAYFIPVTDDSDSPVLALIDVTGLAAPARTPDGNDYLVRPGAGGIYRAGVV